MSRYRLGFPVKVVGAPLRSHDARRWQSSPHLSVSLAYLRDIFGYLQANDIHFYRVAAQLAPYLTHPTMTQFHNQIEESAAELAATGELARAAGLRLTMHPTHYVQMSSPDELTAANARVELSAAAAIFDRMGLDHDAVIVVHVGGVYGDPQSGCERFVRNYERLPAPVRDRLVLENDDHKRYLLAGPLKDPSPFVVIAQTPKVLESARIPPLFADLRVHWGLVLALLLTAACWWLLYRSTIGFAVRTVGLNPSAARYAGISIGSTVVLTMALSGGLAGLAGASEVLGVNYYHTPGFSVGYGFDSIAVALLGRSHPFGVIPAALLFGALRAGSTRMQFVSQIPIDIISVVQGIILLLVAADELVRRLYRVGGRRRVEPERAAEGTVARTWGRAE